MSGQGYQPKKSTTGNGEFRSPPKKPNGNPLNTKVSFQHAMELLYRGFRIHSPSTMYKDTHLHLDLNDGKPVLYKYTPVGNNEWQRETLVNIPTAFLFANDWAIFVVVDKKEIRA